MQEVLAMASAYFPFLHVWQDSEVVDAFSLLCFPLEQDVQVGEAMLLA